MKHNNLNVNTTHDKSNRELSACEDYEHLKIQVTFKVEANDLKTTGGT